MLGCKLRELVSLIGYTKARQLVQDAYDNDRISYRRALRIMGLLRVQYYRQYRDYADDSFFVKVFSFTVQ